MFMNSAIYLKFFFMVYSPNNILICMIDSLSFGLSHCMIDSPLGLSQSFKVDSLYWLSLSYKVNSH